MITIDSYGGLIRFGPLALAWGNTDTLNDFPGFTTLSYGNYSLEFGDIDAGNGIFLTRYADGDIEFTKPIVKL